MKKKQILFNFLNFPKNCETKKNYNFKNHNMPLNILDCLLSKKGSCGGYLYRPGISGPQKWDRLSVPQGLINFQIYIPWFVDSITLKKKKKILYIDLGYFFTKKK